MDPLSVISAVAGLTGTCVKTVKTLKDLHGKYQGAQMTISAICAETSIISVTLSKIQLMLVSNPNILKAPQSIPGLEFDLRATFDIALTGCTMLYSCLEIEVEKLKEHALGAQELGWTEKAKFLWNEDTMKTYLDYLHGQQTSITLLISILQLEKVEDIYRLMKDTENVATLETISLRTKSLRAAYPLSRTARSIFEADKDEDPFDRRDAASTIGSAMFDFDDAIVNSQVYRRTLASRLKDQKQDVPVIEGDLIDLRSISQTTSDPESSMADIKSLKFGDSLATEETRDQDRHPKERSKPKPLLAAEELIPSRLPPRSLNQAAKRRISTSDAYRLCSSESIMGKWALETRRQFLPSQLRLEVLFMTPMIFCALPPHLGGIYHKPPIYAIDGSLKSYVDSRVGFSGKANELDELHGNDSITIFDNVRVSWLNLLLILQRAEMNSREWDQTQIRMSFSQWNPIYTLSACIRPIRRSWSSVPITIDKPFATTRLYDLIDIAAMLGIFWKRFDLRALNFHATGNGMFITSASNQGSNISTVVFGVSGVPVFKGNRVIPCMELEELAHGHVPTILKIGGPVGKRLRFNGDKQIAQILGTFLGCDPETIASFKDKNKHLFPVSFEVIAMLAQTIRIRNSSFRRLPNPTRNSWVPTINIHQLSKTFIDTIGDLQCSDGIAIDIYDMSSTSEDDLHSYLKNSLAVRELIHNALDKTTEWLLNFPISEIVDVFKAHISSVIEAINDPSSPLNASPLTEEKFMEFYVTVIGPRVAEVEDFNSDTVRGKKAMIWIALIYRMLLWLSLHDFAEDDICIIPEGCIKNKTVVMIL